MFPKGEKRQFILEPNMNGYYPENTDLGYPKFHVPTWKQFPRAFMVLYKEWHNSKQLKIHWWVHQRAMYSKKGELFYRAKVLPDNILNS